MVANTVTGHTNLRLAFASLILDTRHVGDCAIKVIE